MPYRTLDLEREIAPLLEAEKMGLMVWSPLAGGLLSGKFSRDTQKPPDSRRGRSDHPCQWGRGSAPAQRTG